MNLGQHMMFPVLAGAIDEATRDRLIAEHLASSLHNNSLSTALVNAGFIPANAFINLSAPGAVVNQTINLLRAPVATLAQTIGLQNTAAVVGHHIGLKATGVPHPNRLQVRNVGMNHPLGLGLNVPGTSNLHQYITGIPEVGINMGSNAPGVNVNPNMNTTNGPKTIGTVVGSSSSGMNTKSPGPSLSHNLATRVVMATGPQNLMQGVAGVNLAHSGVLRNAAWKGATSSAGIQMGPSQGNATHLNANVSQQPLKANATYLNANVSHQRAAVQSVTGYLQQRQKLLGQTYLDEFKQGFPSKGLSVVQNRWWGSTEPSKPVGVLKGTDHATSCSSPPSEGDCKRSTEGDRSKPSVGANHEKVAEEKTKEILVSFAKLVRLRRSAAKRGRSAQQLGVSRGYGLQQLEHQQIKALQFVFGNSLPKQWSSALTTCD